MLKTSHKRKIFVICVGACLLLLGLMLRMGYLMIFCSEKYTLMAQELHERERNIKAARGKIIDSTGAILADNRTVCSVSVIHNQITNQEEVISYLAKELDLSEEYVRKRVEKYSSMERIKSNVSKETGDEIRQKQLDGVKVDEDYKRYYPYDEMASKVLGFTGGDNQGIIGLEVKYDAYLQGKMGKILTVTDARGVEVAGAGERRRESIAGNNLYVSLDMNIQSYATQIAKQVMETKQAEGVSILVMKVKTGEMLAMVDVPEFNLNEPYYIENASLLNDKEKQEQWNITWRNSCINDTYEPGSTFKIITASAGLEAGVVRPEDQFYCPGYIIVDDRRIRCHKIAGHGAETFVEGTMNSCNPVFITVGERLGVDTYYSYFKQFKLLEKTGIDLPGEAGTIMHKPENMGPVELATVSFGQSFQITPIELLATAASLVNNGTRVVPHFAIGVKSEDGQYVKKFTYPEKEHVVSEQTSATMRMILEKVVAEGSGKNGKVEGFRVGGKTATSQTLPRGSGRYIASFIGFAPADDPEIIALAIVHTPQGIYYGGQVAAPIIRQLFENILPYLEDKDYNVLSTFG